MLLVLHSLLLLKDSAAIYAYGGKITAQTIVGGNVEIALNAGVFGEPITAGVFGGNIGVTK